MAATIDRLIEKRMDKDPATQPSRNLTRYHSATVIAPRSPSPSSFSPSPYVINFKGRRTRSGVELPPDEASTSKFRDPGPSEQPGADRFYVKAGGVEGQEGKGGKQKNGYIQDDMVGKSSNDKQKNGYTQDDMVGKSLNDKQTVEARSGEEKKPAVASPAPRRLSFASSGYGEEFFDAADSPFEDTSSQSDLNVSDDHVDELLEAESAEHLQELERYRKAQETLEIVLQKLAAGGLALPPNLLDRENKPQVEEVREQVEDLDIAGQLLIKRMVEAAVARGAAKAEVELNLEAELENKSREVTRLRDKVRYNELVNREMSQRNQEAIEMARNKRRARQRKIRWAVASLSVAAVLGVSAAVMYKYAPWQDIKMWKTKPEGSAPDAVD